MWVRVDFLVAISLVARWPVNRCYTSYTTSIKHALKLKERHISIVKGFHVDGGKRFKYAMCGRVFF